LEYLGIKIDQSKNENVKGETVISTPDSKVKVVRIPTNEELVIALDTQQIVGEELSSLKAASSK